VMISSAAEPVAYCARQLRFQGSTSISSSGRDLGAVWYVCCSCYDVPEYLCPFVDVWQGQVKVQAFPL
jgi:hypothetical protein